MNAIAKKEMIREYARELSTEDRRELGLELLGESHRAGSELEDEQMWIAEMVKRGEAALAEGAELIDAEDLYAYIRAERTTRRTR
jgi:hypothetical protein